MIHVTCEDIEARYRDLDADERARCTTLLRDAEAMVDAFSGENVTDEIKALVCRSMVIRALNSSDACVPIGATQATQTGLGYTQSYTFGSGQSGELYFSRMEKRLLKINARIGSVSPLEHLSEEKANV